MTKHLQAPAVNVPRQERSRASFERVLDAAVELLKERGYEGFTLLEVSKRARTSIGSIYCRVKGKEELFRAVQVYVLEDLTAEMESILDPVKWKDVPPSKLLNFLVRELGEYLRRHGPILRAFIANERGDAVIMRNGKQAHAHLAERFHALLMQHASEFTHPDPAHATSFCFNLAFSAIARHLDLDTVTPTNDGAQWNQLIDDLGRVLTLFLFSEEAFESRSKAGKVPVLKARRASGSRSRR